MGFLRVVYGHKCKSHWVPDELANDIIPELNERFGIKPAIQEPADEGLVDLPGMCMVDRGYEEFKLDGFTLSIPITDVMYYYSELKSLEERQVNGKPYYKIHGWIFCAVLTPTHRQQMMEQIERRQADIKAQELAEDLEFDRRIAEVNQKAGKEVVIAAKRGPDIKDKN